MRRSPDAILYAGTSSSESRSALVLVERRREEHEAELAGARLQLDKGAAIELERLAVGTVRRAEAVLVVVGAVVERTRVQPPVVPLLELDGVHARLLREHEQLLRLLDRALVVVADLGDDEARRVVGDPAAVDLELAHRPIVAPPTGRGASLHVALGTTVLLLGFCLLGIAAACGASLLRLRGIVSFVLAVAVFVFAEIVAVSHALSLFGAYTRVWFLLAVGALAVAAVVTFIVLRPPWPPLDRAGTVARHLVGDPVVAALAGVVVLELGYLTALALFTPPTEGDVLSYHLTRALFWIQQHGVGSVPDATDNRINGLPADAELAQGATMLLSGSIRFTGLVQLTSLVVAVLAIYGTACRIGFARRPAAFGALLFPTLTVVALQAPTALNDLVVAALVAAVMYFTLGRTLGEIAVAGVALALLVGTKPTGLLALPLLFLVCILSYRGRNLAVTLAVGVACIVVGAAWYGFVNAAAGKGVFGEPGDSSGHGGGMLAVAARTTRYAVEAFEVPVSGRDLAVYALAAGVVAVGGLALRRPALVVLGATALTLLPVAVPTLERALHSVYWHGWTFVGYGEATALDPARGASSASSMGSWYGPVGIALTIVSLVLVTRRALRRTLPPVAAVLAWAPPVVLAGTAFIAAYHPLDGRYAMSGVTLGAATWGVVRGSSAGSAATTAVAVTSVAVALVMYAERPAGIGLLEAESHASIWTRPRAWSQIQQPEVARLVDYLDAHATSGETIAVTRTWWVYPFAYVGWPRIEHRLVYADSPSEASRRRAAWAVLPSALACERGWKLAMRSDPWAIYRQDPRARCR